MAETLVGCSINGSWFRINPATGAGTLVGATGFPGLNSLARDAAGSFYSAQTLKLIKINPQTGAAAAVKSLQSVADIRGLAFAPNGTLYGIRNGGPAGSTTDPDELVTIDVGTGAVTLIGKTQHSAIQGLACNRNGVLYGWDLAHGLVRINASTGASAYVNAGASQVGIDIQGIAFASDGTLWGARDKLYRIDLNTSAATLVGTGGYADVRGIEFLTTKSGRWPGIIRYAWLWTILIGGILITPIGPLCIVCGDPLSGVVVRILGAITIGFGVVGLMNELRGPQAGA